jgi:hypothetical protein
MWSNWKRRRSLLAAAGVCLLLAGCSDARTTFLDSEAERNEALATLRGSIGDHPRVLRVEIEPREVAIEAQDPRNPQHVDRWRYVKSVVKWFAFSRAAGPESVELQLIDPDLEANLFDLDSIQFGKTSKLEEEAIKRAQLQDEAAITKMEIARQVYVLPHKGVGDVHWSVYVASGRERAEIVANAAGQVVRVDLGGTLRAKNLNLFKEPSLVADAAADFRSAVGSGPNLVSVGIDHNSVAFATNARDTIFGKGAGGIPTNALYTWDLSGLAQRIGHVDLHAMTKQDAEPTFSVDDVDWSLAGKIEADALAASAIPKALVTEIHIAKDVERPGPPALAWEVHIATPDEETAIVFADVHGAISRIDLPESLRPKIDWLNPSALAGALAKLPSQLGGEVKVASLNVSDQNARITIDDPGRAGQTTTFDFKSNGLLRGSIVLNDQSNQRYEVKDLAFLTEQKLTALEADAMKRLGGKIKLYLDSLTIGPHPFAPKLGARAIEIRFRDTPESSVKSEWAWIVYDFNGKVQDFSGP